MRNVFKRAMSALAAVGMPERSSVEPASGLKKLKTVELEYEFEPKPRNGGVANPMLRNLISRGAPRYIDHLQYLVSIRDDFYDIREHPDPENPAAPNWDNGFLPGLDIVTLHAMLRRYNPKRMFEIGSGNSTKVARRAINMHGLQTTITSVDPCPRAEIDALCDRVVRTGIENTDLEEVLSLESGDLLFFDGSHHAFMNSDVTVFFLEIVPKLPPGVFVHIHDICLPYDYPEHWWNRFYSEQYLLACALLYAPERFQIEVPNMYLSWEPEFHRLVNEFWADPQLQNPGHKHGASFWFRLRS